MSIKLGDTEIGKIMLGTLEIAKVFHGDVQVYPSSNSLIAQETFHAHLVDVLNLLSLYDLVSADTLHIHLADGTILTSAYDLISYATLHNHLVDNAILQSFYNLIDNDTLHSHLAEVIAIFSKYGLVSFGTLHSHFVDEVAIFSKYGLVLLDGLHAISADSPLLTTAGAPTYMEYVGVGGNGIHTGSAQRVGVGIPFWNSNLINASFQMAKEDAWSHSDYVFYAELWEFASGSYSGTPTFREQSVNGPSTVELDGYSELSPKWVQFDFAGNLYNNPIVIIVVAVLGTTNGALYVERTMFNDANSDAYYSSNPTNWINQGGAFSTHFRINN